MTLETIWHYRRMFLRPSYRKVGMLGVPYYALFECLAPLFQLLSIVTLALVMLFWPILSALWGRVGRRPAAGVLLRKS